MFDLLAVLHESSICWKTNSFNFKSSLYTEILVTGFPRWFRMNVLLTTVSCWMINYYLQMRFAVAVKYNYYNYICFRGVWDFFEENLRETYKDFV